MGGRFGSAITDFMRHRFLILVLTLSLPGVMFARVESADVTLDYVVKRAEERARKPFRSPRADLPEALQADKLDYNKYREIGFRHEKALWAAENLPFRVEFFHPGYLYQEPVHINEFTPTHVQPIRFVRDFFNYGGLKIQDQIPADTGYAGFRLLTELNQPGRWDELGAFLGASYFRLLGKGQSYGQSARGLAIDSGEPDRPEEFPIFTDWWLGKPQREDNRVKLYGLLDSASCAGAFQFIIVPGESTVADVTAILYFRKPEDIAAVSPGRKPVKTLGLAPLTSMYWFGKSSERRFDDYRPEVHDSDGLLMHMGNGEVLWRPLNNPTSMRHQRFVGRDVRGFGLMQREREFQNYQDLFNRYDHVPSVWVDTLGRWGEGEIHLVELPTNYEGLDNIVAFWDPKRKPAPLEPFNFSYSLRWMKNESDMKLSEQDKVTATRVGVDPTDPKRRQFAIDFGGPLLSAMPENTPPMSIATCSDNAVIVENQVFRNPVKSTWRVMLKIEPKPENRDPVDIRCTLEKGEEVLTETWTYLWSPL